MVTTPAQLATFKASITADGILNALPKNEDTALIVVAAYNLSASPAYWVWKTSVTAQEIYETTTVDATTWSWTTFIARSQGERDAWATMFAVSGMVNPSLANTRQGIADIFSGVGGATQRTHLLTIGRRQATRFEQLFATGSGTTAAPSTMAVEGLCNSAHVLAAWALP